MAADVDRSLRGVIARHGGTSDDEARARLNALAASGRYRRDVY